GGLTSTEGKGLEATVGQPRVKGNGHGAKCGRKEAEPLTENRAVQGRNDPDDVREDVDRFNDRVDDDGCAVGERGLDVWRHEGVVDDNDDVVKLRYTGDGGDVDKGEGWVRRSLNPDELGAACLDEGLDVELNVASEGYIDI